MSSEARKKSAILIIIFIRGTYKYFFYDTEFFDATFKLWINGVFTSENEKQPLYKLVHAINTNILGRGGYYFWRVIKEDIIHF